MLFALPTVCTIAMVSVGAVIAAPALYRAFKRRGKGVYYESNFLVQRAPQVATAASVTLTTLSVISGSKIALTQLAPFLSLSALLPSTITTIISWTGVAVLGSGLVFMIGGWYSLGECFSTDAELLDGQTVKRTGMLKYVMHPAYSGIIQSTLGAALATGSYPAALLVLFVVSPLWLNRAKYEERLLIESLGPDYRVYADELGWRRLIPKCIPGGV